MPNSKSWSSVSVGVTDLDAALALWQDTFGMELVSTREGPDPDLARLWGLSANDFDRQALLRAPGQSVGQLHLVQYVDPGPVVREGAQVFDLCPKNLDIYVSDLPRRHQELLKAGHRFRTESYSEITAPNGIRFREIHMPSHDRINVVLLELLGEELPFSEQGFSAVGPLITIVDDAEKEKSFYNLIIGLDLLSQNILEGSEIEKMIGLPPGSALDVSIWGGSGSPLGQVEIIDYRGVEGTDLYPGAKPGARGILHISYPVKDLPALTRKLDTANIAWQDHGRVEALPVRGKAIHFHSPAGLRIEAWSE
jgi:catechol 2,3-dioxygenase-like lactoylglutathione lyase family enzyme